MHDRIRTEHLNRGRSMKLVIIEQSLDRVRFKASR
jgi:hypothetical protein